MICPAWSGDTKWNGHSLLHPGIHGLEGEAKKERDHYNSRWLMICSLILGIQRNSRLKSLTLASVGEGMAQWAYLKWPVRGWRRRATLEHNLAIPRKLTMHLPCDPASPLSKFSLWSRVFQTFGQVSSISMNCDPECATHIFHPNGDSSDMWCTLFSNQFFFFCTQGKTTGLPGKSL